MTKNYSIIAESEEELSISINAYKDAYSIFELIVSCIVFTCVIIFIEVNIPINESWFLKSLPELYLLFWIFRMIKSIIWFVNGYEIINIQKSEARIYFHRKGFGIFHKKEFEIINIKFFHVKKHQLEHFYTAENRTSNGLKNGQLVFERLEKKWYQSQFFHFGHSLTDLELGEVYHLIQSKIDHQFLDSLLK